MKKQARHDTGHAERNTPFYRNQKVLAVTLTTLFLLIALFTAVYFRLATVDLRVTDEIAKNTLQQNVLNQITQQIRQQYPTLPDSAVQAEAQKRWLEFAKTNAAEIDTQSKLYSQQIKAQYQFEAGTERPYQQTYLLEMDPYLAWHQAENYAAHESVCDPGSPQTDDGGCMDMKRLAPDGTRIDLNFHVWLEAQLIKIGRVLNPNLSSLTIVFFTPVLLAALAVIPAFFLGRKLAGNMGGFVAAMIIATHPVLMNRTIAGFADTDGYSIMFPLLIVWIVFEALEAKHLWSRLSLAALAGFFVGLYSFAWGTFWFTFFILVVCFVVFLLYRLAVVLKKNKFRNFKGHEELHGPSTVFGMFLVCSALGISLFSSFIYFVRAFTAPFTFNANLQSATSQGGSILSGWPNILTTVAELNIPSLGQMVGNLGGILVVTLAGFGLFVSLLNPKQISWSKIGAAVAALLYYYLLSSKGLGLSSTVFLILYAMPLAIAVAFIFFKDLPADLRYPFFMMGWLLATLFAATKGIRFLLLGITPFAIGVGIAIGWLFLVITSALQKEIKRPLLVQTVVGVVVLLIVFNPAAAYSPLKQGKQAAEGQFPGMNDAWWQALQVIREQTPPETIITSWWDFGHWFRNIGDRAVTFDGASQNPEPGHLVGRILLSPNETESIGLLRMLDCGHNNAYQIAHRTLEVLPARELITQLVTTDKAGAWEILLKTNIPPEEQKIILEYTHCTPPPAVFITSSDMTGKAGVWGHFGAWDFRRALAYDAVSSLPQTQAVTKLEELGYSSAESLSVYNSIRAFRNEGEANGWISPWPGYFTQNWVGCNSVGNGTNTTMVCPLNMGIQQTAQGTIVLEDVSFNSRTPLNATIGYALYSNGAKASATNRLPLAKVVYADVNKQTMTRAVSQSDGFTIGSLIRAQTVDNSTQYSILLADPLQTESLYTHLYYLDGAFTKHFTKLVDNRAAGIIVWTVNWPKD